MITCPKCNEPATARNNSPEMREWLFFWCYGCNTIVMPLIEYLETDPDRELCHDAHRGTSFRPNVRAQQEIDGYMDEMKAVSARFAPFVTEGNKRALMVDLEQYRKGYLKRLNARLSAKANCLSTMITGSSNFNYRRNQKANTAEHRRTTELLEWREKALKRLNRDYNPAVLARRPIRSDEADAIEQLKAKIEAAQKDRDFMKVANRIVKSKKLSIGDKITKFAKIGVSEETARKFSEEPNGHGGYGFAPYELSNNNANIKRMKARVKQIEAEASRPEVEDREGAIDGTLVTVVENRDEGRLQLVFDGKPPQAIIQTLKSNGFNWSRTNGAWQRLLNDNARRIVDTLMLLNPKQRMNDE